MSYEESLGGVGREVDGLLAGDTGTIAGLQAELTNTQALLAGANELVTSLQQQNSDLSVQLAAANATIVRKNARIATLKGLLEECRAASVPFS